MMQLNMLDIMNLLTSLGLGILVLIAFYWVAVIIHRRVGRYIVKRKLARQLAFNLLNDIIKNSLIIVGITSMLAQWGLDISTILTGLGITGFAVGFAMKDILSCIISGLVISIYEPFKDGDAIEVLGIKGEIIKIDLKYTVIQEGRLKHLIPNSKLLNEAITIIVKD
jgi:small-conductance mechanosensitive channel